MVSLMSCEQEYYYKFIRNLEKKQFVKYFIEGNMFQYGIYKLMIGKSIKEAESLMLKKLQDHLKTLRKELSISTQDEQMFVEMKIVLTGMLRAYAIRYKKDLKIEKHIANESMEIISINNDVSLGIQMDNILEVKKKWYLHEGKAWKYLNNSVVENVKNSFQIATYFYAHNNSPKVKKPFSGIIFDAVQKPSIRKGKNEQYKNYLKRLEAYYTGPDSNNKFLKELIDKPEIKYEDWLRTISRVATRAIALAKGKVPLKTFANCSWCDYYPLCFEGEIKRNLIMYKTSEYSKRYNKKRGGV